MHKKDSQICLIIIPSNSCFSTSFCMIGEIGMLSIVFRLTCCFSGTTSRLWTFSSKLTLTTLSVVTSGPCSTLVFSLSSIFSSTFLLFSSSSCFLFASSASNLQHVCFVFCGYKSISGWYQINLITSI